MLSAERHYCPHPAAAKLLQSCSTMCDSIDGSPSGSPVPEILQARTLEWVAISFSHAWKWKVKGKSLSCIWLFVTPWTAAYQALPPMVFSRQEYWSGVPLPSLCPHPRDVKIKSPMATHLESSKAEIQARHSNSKSVLLTSSMHSHQPVREGSRTGTQASSPQSSLFISGVFSKLLLCQFHWPNFCLVSEPPVCLFTYCYPWG